MPDSPEGSTPLAEERAGCGSRILSLLVLGLLILGAAFYFTFRQEVESVAVAGFEWRRSMDIEALRTVREEAWEEDVPPEARKLSERREVHHTEPEQVATERIRVGTRDTGNGTLEDVYSDRPVYRNRPVYGTKSTYEVERWVVVRTARADGLDQSPRWPEPDLAAGEREGRRSEGYTVLLEGRRKYRKELTESRWSSLHVGQRLMATVRGGTVENLE